MEKYIINMEGVGYYFIYKNSINKWNSALSLEFIARHTFCRALPADKVKSIFKDLKFLLDILNNNHVLNLSNKQQEFIKEFIN